MLNVKNDVVVDLGASPVVDVPNVVVIAGVTSVVCVLPSTGCYLVLLQ